MEHDHGVEGVELGAHHAEVQADDDGVEDDAELEDQEGGDLLLEGAVARCFVYAVGFVAFGTEFLLVEARGCGCGCGFDVGPGGFLARRVLVNVATGAINAGVRCTGHGFLHVRVILKPILDLDIALCREIEEEDHDDGGQDDGWTPGIVGPMARHANACVGSDLAVCRVQEVDECRGDDDAGPEVAGEEVDIERDVELGDALGDDGEEGYGGGEDEDDEQGRDAGA